MSNFALTQDDAILFLMTLEPERADLIITDPAYSSLEKHRAKGTTTRLKVSDGSSNEWFPVVPNEYFVGFFEQCYRVLKKNSHMYILCDVETMLAIKPMGEAVGFSWWSPIVWDKMKIGMGYHYRSQYELILFFEKGKRKLNNLGIPNVLRVPRVHGGFPTEKPVELLETLVTQSSQPGELCVDPFMGSGSTGMAALKHGRRFLGCDITVKAFEEAARRLSGPPADIRQLPLPVA